MEAFEKSLVAATLISVCTATASAQNSPAAQGGSSRQCRYRPARRGRAGRQRPRPSGAVPTDRPAATTPQLILGPTAGSETQIPADGGITRGGPDNPSGLKKPD
jgi:hypothetical protein